jgi:hypothetical protein
MHANPKAVDLFKKVSREEYGTDLIIPKTYMVQRFWKVGRAQEKFLSLFTCN